MDNSTPRRRIVRHKERQAITGITNPTWYRLPVADAPAWSDAWKDQIAAGAVPQAIELGPNQVGFFDDELFYLNEIRGRNRRSA
jgi:predicted DNA-binding transcriptional regulator AlpA